MQANYCHRTPTADSKSQKEVSCKNPLEKPFSAAVWGGVPQEQKRSAILNRRKIPKQIGEFGQFQEPPIVSQTRA